MSFATKVNVNTKEIIKQMRNKRAMKLLSYSMRFDLHQTWRAGRKRKR